MKDPANLTDAITKIYDHCEADKVEAATMAALRVARLSNDYVSAAYFMRELFPNREEVSGLLAEDMDTLGGEALKLVWEQSLDRWMEVHTMDYAFPSGQRDGGPGGQRDVLAVAVGEIEGEIAFWTASVQQLSPPSGLSAFDTAAFANAAAGQRGEIQLRLMALNTIRSRLKTRCFSYALRIERQLKLQTRNTSILFEVQNEVNNYFSARSEDVYKKLLKAAELASASGEDAALLLTEVRRVLKAVADHFRPASSEAVVCSDGKSRVLGEEQYMNRMEEHLCSTLRSTTAKDLVLAELRLLATFLRRLNDLASKGVHASVSTSEARQGFVGLYMFLFSVCQHAQSATGASAELLPDATTSSIAVAGHVR